MTPPKFYYSKGLEHPWYLVSVGCPGTKPLLEQCILYYMTHRKCALYLVTMRDFPGVTFHILSFSLQILSLNWTLHIIKWTAFLQFLNHSHYLFCLTKTFQGFLEISSTQVSISCNYFIVAWNVPTAYSQTEKQSTLGKFDELTKAIQ